MGAVIKYCNTQNMQDVIAQITGGRRRKRDVSVTAENDSYERLSLILQALRSNGDG